MEKFDLGIYTPLPQVPDHFCYHFIGQNQSCDPLNLKGTGKDGLLFDTEGKDWVLARWQ